VAAIGIDGIDEKHVLALACRHSRSKLPSNSSGDDVQHDDAISATCSADLVSATCIADLFSPYTGTMFSTMFSHRCRGCCSARCSA
jgi:hypothetical protein